MPGPELLIGGRYRLVEQIAAGGMGSVWEAWDERLHRRVAIKQLHPPVGLSDADVQLASSRAMREARITARLHHPHAVPVYDVLDHDGMPCLIMQYLPSKSLQSLLGERGTLSVAQVARIGSEVAAALAAAHSVGIVHRDVKPGNVLIDSDGAARLTDFGISHALGDVTLTSTGMVTGTPAYLAPEVARGVESGFASDVYSLGATLYTASEGMPPSGPGENPMAVLHRVASGQITAPRHSGQLTPLLTQMLAADPADRPSMAQAAEALQALNDKAGDPAGIATTQPMGQPAPTPSPAPLPTTTATLPPAPPQRPRRHYGRTGVIALAGLLLAAAIVLATQLGGGSGTPPPRSNGSPTVSNSASHAAPSSPRSSAAHTSAAATKAGDTSRAKNGGAPTSDAIQAVESYYGLLPGDTATAWGRLTANYQAQTGGRGSYDSFWHSFRSVDVSNERMQGSQVLADLRYTSTAGVVSTETRSFQLVPDGGTLKIAGSEVVAG